MTLMKIGDDKELNLIDGELIAEAEARGVTKGLTQAAERLEVMEKVAVDSVFALPKPVDYQKQGKLVAQAAAYRSAAQAIRAKIKDRDNVSI